MSTIAARPIKHIPALQDVPLPSVSIGQEFPSLGWWWRIVMINRDADSRMVVRPVRPTNKTIKIANDHHLGR